MKPQELLKAIGSWKWMWATAGGLGHMWPASGTWGSLPPCVMLLGVQWWGGSLGVMLAVLFGLLALSSTACIRYGEGVESATGRKDPSVVVIDEVAGMSLTLLLGLAYLIVFGHPPGHSIVETIQGSVPSSLIAVLTFACFVFFRVMDVIKPPPARALQSIPGGWGILIDDLVVAPYAAVAAVVCLETLVRMGPIGV